MNLYIRLIYVFIASFIQRATSTSTTIATEQRLSFITFPNDLDFNMHMNNGRYLTLMDLGRLHLMIRFGLFGTILRKRWMPVVGEAHIRFRRSLSPFQPFELTTRILSWDEKWIYIEQKFISRGQLMAIAHVKGLILRGKNSVPTTELVELMGHKGPPPEAVPDVFSPPKER